MTFEVDLVGGDPSVSPEGEFDISTDASVGNIGINDMDDSVVFGPRVSSRNIYDVCKVDNVTVTGGLLKVACVGLIVDDDVIDEVNTSKLDVCVVNVGTEYSGRYSSCIWEEISW